jgi:hypothetical protein
MWGCAQKPQKPQIIDLSQIDNDDKGTGLAPISYKSQCAASSLITSHSIVPLTQSPERRFDTHARPDLFTETAEWKPISFCQPKALGKPQEVASSSSTCPA